MPGADQLLKSVLDMLPSKLELSKKQSDKKRYSELMSATIAAAFSELLRERGMIEALPSPASARKPAGAERRMSGGIGAKKVDVTWATEESGLLFSISIKTINWPDGKSRTYQKNLTNRRGDMLFEAVTLHRRFPYAVLYGFLFLDAGAAEDDTSTRSSTFENAHVKLRMFSGRDDPAGREEQYERLFIVLVNAAPDDSAFEVYRAEDLVRVSLEDVFSELLELIVTRNPDFYEVRGGKLKRI